jgi:uncharacterized protein (UPF0261 family)
MFVPTPRRRLIKLPHHINDRPFAEALVRNFLDVVETTQSNESERPAWRA